jgi:hypothetical protein
MDYKGKKLFFLAKVDDFSDEALDRQAREFVRALRQQTKQPTGEPMAMPRASRPAKKAAAKRPRSK